MFGNMPELQYFTLVTVSLHLYTRYIYHIVKWRGYDVHNVSDVMTLQKRRFVKSAF